MVLINYCIPGRACEPFRPFVKAGTNTRFQEARHPTRSEYMGWFTQIICEHAKRPLHVRYQHVRTSERRQLRFPTIVVKNFFRTNLTRVLSIYMVSRTWHFVWNIALSRKHGSFRHSPFDALHPRITETWHCMPKWLIWHKMWFIWWVDTKWHMSNEPITITVSLQVWIWPSLLV